MKYNGIELTEFKSDKAVVFDPPKKMLVWDENIEAREDLVYAYIPKRFVYKVIGHSCAWTHCAEIPKESKPRRATNLELVKWLAQGNGEKSYAFADGSAYSASCDFFYERGEEDRPLPECGSLLVRKWDDKEWREPTADYMGLEDGL